MKTAAGLIGLIVFSVIVAMALVGSALTITLPVIARLP